MFQSAPVIADGRTPLTHRTLLPNDFFRLFREPVAENHVRIKDTEHPKKNLNENKGLRSARTSG